MDCTNKNCPAYAKCLAPYRGSRCAATRAKYGLGDPLTNADRFRAMTDEKMAEKIGESIDCEVCKTMHHSESGECPCRPHQACVDFWLEWLRQEATNDGDD